MAGDIDAGASETLRIRRGGGIAHEGVLAACVSLWAIAHFRVHHNQLRRLARRMSPAAYGAFIVHPPVLVGLALAIQHAPVPAELKFLCVLAGGVAGSFGLAALAAHGRPVARIIGGGPRPAPI